MSEKSDLIKQAKKFRVIYQPVGTPYSKSEELEARDAQHAASLIRSKHRNIDIKDTIDLGINSIVETVPEEDIQSEWMQQIPLFDRTQDYEKRIRQKEAVESFIWDKINDVVPWQVVQTGTKEDMAGIDAVYWQTKDGKPVSEKSVQLKMRESGDDILMEVIKPWPIQNAENLWSGRDMKTPVDEYFCIDRDGMLRIIPAERLKRIAKDMVKEFVQQYRSNPSLRSAHLQSGTVKIVTDPSSEAAHDMGKVNKLVVFIEPDKAPVQQKISLMAKQQNWYKKAAKIDLQFTTVSKHTYLDFFENYCLGILNRVKAQDWESVTNLIDIIREKAQEQALNQAPELESRTAL